MASIGLRHWAGVAAIGLFATGLVAQPPAGDPLAAARAQQKIADQKIGQSVADALRDADRLAKTNPAKAAQILKAAQSDIDLAVGISGDARTKLSASVQAKLNGTASAPAATVMRPDSDAGKLSRKAAFDKYDAEIKAVKEGLALIERYQEARRYSEAQGMVALLAKQYPDNAAVLALQQKDSISNNVAEAKALTQLHAERYTVAMNSVARSNMPAVNDIEFSKNWKDITEKRKKGEPQLTEKEKTLLAALDKPVTAAFNGQPLEEVLQRMSNLMDQNLFLDAKSLTDLGLDLKKPLTLDAKGVPARIVLRQLLASQGLTFVVKDEIVQIVTVEKAREMLVTRVYYLGDVVKGVGTFGGLGWGPYIDHEQTKANVKTIMDSITSSIDPLSWSGASGPGSIKFDYLSMSLIVRASTEVHASLGAKLGGGR
jgi:hypothetical protein